MKTRIQPLPSEDALLFRSFSSLGSFYLVAEELMMNSIESQATSIDVFIDKSKYLLMVKDDGFGIGETDLRDSIGEWDRSSKLRDNKGQGLAALRTVSDSLEVISKTGEHRTALSKKMNRRDGSVVMSEVPALSSSLPLHGTIVIAFNIYALLPVRQKAIRWDNEISQIKDWIMRMSLFHHSINWSVTELSQSQSICSIKSTASVVQSLVANFGCSILSKVCHVDIEYHGYHLVGLISDPKHDACLANKHHQMLYLHGRLLHQSDIVGTILNKAFSRYLATQNCTGFNAKHVNLQAENSAKYPFFLLQLTCPSFDDYDVLIEPNKSTVYFRQPTEVEHLVFLLLRQFQSSTPGLSTVIESLIEQYNVANSGTRISNVLPHPSFTSATPSQQQQQYLQPASYPGKSPVSLLLSGAASQSPAMKKMLLDQALRDVVTSTADLYHRKSTAELLTDAFALPSMPPTSSPQYHQSDTKLFSPSIQTTPMSQKQSRFLHTPGNTPQNSSVDADRYGDQSGLGVTVHRNFSTYQSHHALSRAKTSTAKNNSSYMPNKNPIASVTAEHHNNEEHQSIPHTAIQNPSYQSVVTNNNYSIPPPVILLQEDSVDSEEKEGDEVMPIGDFLIHSEERLGQYIFHSAVDAVSGETQHQRDSSSNNNAQVRHIEHRLDRLNEQDSTRRKRPLKEVLQPLLNENTSTENTSVSKRPRNYVVSRTESVTLLRESVADIQCLGQVDRKYIACLLSVPAISNASDETHTSPHNNNNNNNNNFSNNNNFNKSNNFSNNNIDISSMKTMLVLLDQHAVDERIHLEQLQPEAGITGMTRNRQTILLSPPQRLYVDWSTLQILQEKCVLLQSWCFTYHILPPSSQSQNVLNFGEHNSTNTSNSPFTVDILSVPMVEDDEILTAEDLVEFCAHLQTHRDIPDSLQAPPAIHRILTSKACRAALKFGQVLQRQEMLALLQQWQETKIPFQCAHGRPSIVPMVDVSQLSALVQTYEDSLASIDITSLFP